MTFEETKKVYDDLEANGWRKNPHDYETLKGFDSIYIEYWFHHSKPPVIVRTRKGNDYLELYVMMGAQYA